MSSNIFYMIMDPMIYGIVADHSDNNVIYATIFPHNIGHIATRDTNLVKRIGATTIAEVRAIGISYAFAPCIDRSNMRACYESYSEDNELVQSMNKIVLGLQGKNFQGSRLGVPYVDWGILYQYSDDLQYIPGVTSFACFSGFHGWLGPMKPEPKPPKASVAQKRRRSFKVETVKPKELEDTVSKEKMETEKTIAKMFDVLKINKKVRLENLLGERWPGCDNGG
ncbi:putative glucan 1,3-beta-glucosidase [Helianthus annuus]|nr:putative glucan 1,3-beta-glucosidase [Helianthus annuus]